MQGKINQKKSLPILKRNPALIWSIFAVVAYVCSQLDWMTCVTAAPGFALPVEVGCFILLKIVQECPEESPLLLRWMLWVCLGVGCRAIWSLLAALQELQASSSALRVSDESARCRLSLGYSSSGSSGKHEAWVSLCSYSTSSAPPQCRVSCAVQSVYLCPGNLRQEIQQPMVELKLFHLHNGP